MSEEEQINWTQEQMLEVTLKEPDDFLKVPRETLSRIGVASRKERTLYQSAHILHKRGRYFILPVCEKKGIECYIINTLKNYYYHDF
jgi:hypothetical protein